MPKITFKNPTALKIFDPKCIEVKPGTSILDAAEECHARVGHACGGNLACSTCHVYVEQGLDSLPEITDKENDIMDKAFDVRAESRLGCQAKVADDDIVVLFI
jgi:2Fe-2S ferredoxin